MRLMMTAFVVAGATIGVPALAQPRDDSRALHDTMREIRERAYQGRNNGPEQTERFSRKVKIGRDGRVSVGNIAGDITVTTGSGDEVSIEALKRTRGDRSELARIRINVDERAGRVEVTTEHEQNRTDRNRRSEYVSVDYTLVVPATASVDLHSVSGSVKVTGVHGSLRADTISGNVTMSDTPKLESAKTVSGSVSLTGSYDGDATAGSISGRVMLKGVRAHGLDLGSISGDIIVTDVTCDRLGVKSVSGNVEYAGAINKTGRYEINTHSGTVRLTLADPAGFELNASSFSGSIRSDLPLTIGGDSSRGGRDTSRRGSAGMNSHNMRATFGDGSATLTIRTFSGDIVIAKR